MTEVTQADIDLVDDIFLGSIRQSERNDEWLLNLIVSHRIASDRAGYERGQRETVARIVAWLRGIGFGDADQNRARAKFEIMKAIEAGEWK